MSDQTTTETTSQAPQASGTNLQLSDLYVAIQAITLASSRGAFRPEEFAQIGSVYDRIFAFLKESGAIAPAPAQGEADSGSAPATAA